MKKFSKVSVMLTLILCLAGCGYTQKGQMPNDIKSLAVPTFINVIKAKNIYTYESGLEVRITNAIRDRLIFDGNVKLAEPSSADAVLLGKLIRYEQEPIGYDNLERVDRYRVVIHTELTLKDLRTNDVIWHEPNFTGEVIYDLRASGIQTTEQRKATDQAIQLLARDVVDRMVEDW